MIKCVSIEVNEIFSPCLQMKREVEVEKKPENCATQYEFNLIFLCYCHIIAV